MLALVILAGIFLINVVIYPPQPSELIKGTADFTIVDKFTLSNNSKGNNYVRLHCKDLNIQIMICDSQIYRHSNLGTSVSLPYTYQYSKYTFPTTNCILVEDLP